MSIERIQQAAENISKKKDRVDYRHIVNYCRKAWGLDLKGEYHKIKGALEEINCYPISKTKFDLTGIDSIHNYADIAKEKHSSVYIVGSLEQGICKIGHSINPEQRLSDIQVGCPFKIELLRVIEEQGRDFERYLHNRFRHYNTSGEWFNIEGELKDFINHKIKL